MAGTPTCPDRAGSGGSAANPEFTARLTAGDRSADDPLCPRLVMRTFFSSPSLPAAIEDALLTEVLHTAVGPTNYPGDVVESPNWPGFGPGATGTQNAMSPRWCDTSEFAFAAAHAPVLWLRGDGDQVISDASAFDVGTLGELGQVPGRPGAAYPPQPQVAQIRAMLDRRQAAGCDVREVVLRGTAHGVLVERPAEVAALIEDHVARVAGPTIV